MTSLTEVANLLHNAAEALQSDANWYTGHIATLDPVHQQDLIWEYSQSRDRYAAQAIQLKVGATILRSYARASVYRGHPGDLTESLRRIKEWVESYQMSWLQYHQYLTRPNISPENRSGYERQCAQMLAENKVYVRAHEIIEGWHQP